MNPHHLSWGRLGALRLPNAWMVWRCCQQLLKCVNNHFQISKPHETSWNTKYSTYLHNFFRWLPPFSMQKSTQGWPFVVSKAKSFVRVLWYGCPWNGSVLNFHETVLFHMEGSLKIRISWNYSLKGRFFYHFFKDLRILTLPFFWLVWGFMFGISCKLRPSKYSIMHGWKIPQSSKIFPSELWWILEWGCLVKCSVVVDHAKLYLKWLKRVFPCLSLQQFMGWSLLKNQLYSMLWWTHPPKRLWRITLPQTNFSHEKKSL